MKKLKATTKAKKVAKNPPSIGVDDVIVQKTSHFRIVGIGASAGGLEAIEDFLKAVPPNSGMAFVIVQHLDPHYKGMMCELLQRVTPLTVRQITDRMIVRPNHVYVIPPAKDLSILNGVLHLLDPVELRGLRLPINYFFRSLAADQKQYSIGVILSGMGSDGTLGLQAIKEYDGVALVQSPDSAKFDSMPYSAINAGLADVVATAAELVLSLIRFGNLTSRAQRRSSIEIEDSNQNALEKIAVLLRTQTGHDFSLYKKNTLYRRIERRMVSHKIASIVDYVHFLRTDQREADMLFKELLIGVTSFFRDPEVWEQLKTETIPALLAHRPEGGTLRAWVPACSTGEEAYTLAVVFLEALEHAKPTEHYSLQIFATDLDNEAIDTARRAIYSASISEDIPEKLLSRYFWKTGDSFRVSSKVREMVIFAPQNLVMDPPFTKLDILTCRNLLIYLEAELQEDLFSLFHYSLNPNGILVLGTAETVGATGQLFTAYPGKNRIYRRRTASPENHFIEFPTRDAVKPDDKASISNLKPAAQQIEQTEDLQVVMNTLLVKNFCSASLLTSATGDIFYINGKTGKYLEPSAGKIDNNIFAMARSGLAGPLNEAYTRANRLRETIDLKNISVGSEGGTQCVNLSVIPILEPPSIRGMVLTVIVDSNPTEKALRDQQPLTDKKSTGNEIQISTLKKEVERSHRELQTTRDEIQVSQEELKSTNEELQSTNEELTTSKEEMQSMNEELHSVNHELGAKVDELSQTSDDMKNLFDSTNIATLFLDNSLNIRRFTTQATKIFKLIPSDIGRPITDLSNVLNYPSLAKDAQKVLHSLVFNKVLVSTTDDHWFEVRIMPYRTQDNRIDGLVITFFDSTENQNANRALHKSESRFRLLFENSLNAVAYQKIILKDGIPIDFTYLEVNNAFSAITGLQDVTGRNQSDIVSSIDMVVPQLFEVCGRVAETGESAQFEYFVKATRQWFCSSIYSQEDGFFVTVTENITVLKEIGTILDKAGVSLDESTDVEIGEFDTISKLKTELAGLRKIVNDTQDIFAQRFNSASKRINQ